MNNIFKKQIRWKAFSRELESIFKRINGNSKTERNTITQIKNSMDRFDSTLDTVEKQIHRLEKNQQKISRH